MWTKAFYNQEEYDYFVSDDGQVKNINGELLSQHKINTGYMIVGLSKHGTTKNCLVHRLVLESFNPVEGLAELQVNHKDFDKTNNYLSNLEWMTRSENNLYNYQNGHHSKNKEVHQYSIAGEYIDSYYSVCEAER